jgi:hypothetical protein
VTPLACPQLSSDGLARDDLSDSLAALHVLQRRAPARFFAGAHDTAAVAGALLHRCPDQTPAAAEAGYLTGLAQAYALSGDEQPAQHCVGLIDAQLGDPRFEHVTAATARDAAARLIERCWALLLIRTAPVVTASWVARVLTAIARDADYLHRSLSQYCPPPTHLTSEALGLFYAAVVFPELPGSAAWRDAAVRVLAAESRTQIAADGVHTEQSSWFHRVTVDVYLHFLLLAARNRIPVPPGVPVATQRMVDFLLAIRRPDGSLPTIGDSDGRRLLSLAQRTPTDARDVFAVAAALFGRPDFAWAAEGFAPEVAWLTGPDGIAAFDALRPAPPPTARSRVFPAGGYAVMSTGWERDAHQMLVDVGPIGCAVSSGHGHADLLSVQCSVFGAPAIIDPGTHCYSGDSKWRDYFRSTVAHNTVTIDGESQADASGPFGWRRRPHVRLREWHSTPDFDFLDAEHDGYTRLSDPVRHRRRVIFVKPAFWILIDDLSGTTRHRVELAFQVATGDVALRAHPWARVAIAPGRVLWISPFPSAPAQPTLKCGELSPIRGWIAPELGRLRPAPMLIYSFAVALPWRIVTLLLPDRQGLSTPAVRPIHDDGGLPNGFVFERPRRTVHFDDRAVTVERD